MYKSVRVKKQRLIEGLTYIQNIFIYSSTFIDITDLNSTSNIFSLFLKSNKFLPISEPYKLKSYFCKRKTIHLRL